MDLQPRLFDDLPPTREETPVHQLNYPTFAGAENTVWHGRSRQTWNSDHEAWDPERDLPAHVGTFEAAAHRVLGESDARNSAYTPGGDMQIITEGYRPREDLMQAAGLRSAQPVTGGTPSDAQMIPFRIRKGSMANDPSNPVSDAHANIAAGEDDHDSYTEEYLGEMIEAGAIYPEDMGQITDPYEAIADHLPDSIDDTGGLYYRNEHEDEGSISAVVPTARDLHHWPTEVMENSTNPAQRRTAEFLLGRGY